MPGKTRQSAPSRPDRYPGSQDQLTRSPGERQWSSKTGLKGSVERERERHATPSPKTTARLAAARPAPSTA